jgi:hypothetical protein
MIIRPAGVAQSVERVALIFSDTSKPQGRGFEPLLRLFLQLLRRVFLSSDPLVVKKVVVRLLGAESFGGWSLGLADRVSVGHEQFLISCIEV